jgi:hypothetical protein
MRADGKSIPRKLVYRSPRFRVDLPVTVYDGMGRAISGRCTEMSTEGAGIRLRDSPSTDDTLRIDLSLGAHVVSLNAGLVYRREGNFFGVRFLPSCAEEKETIARIIEFIQHRG